MQFTRARWTHRRQKPQSKERFPKGRSAESMKNGRKNDLPNRSKTLPKRARSSANAPGLVWISRANFGKYLKNGLFLRRCVVWDPAPPRGPPSRVFGVDSKKSPDPKLTAPKKSARSVESVESARKNRRSQKNA